MKNIAMLLFILIASLASGQENAAVGKSFYKHIQSEKAYAHLNNVLYLPEETVFYKLYVTNADNSPTMQSDYAYVEIYDSAGKKLDTQCYRVVLGGAAGSFTLTAAHPGGMYRLKAYTRLQEQLGEPAFEKSFFVQKASANRMLMTLDFRRKGYGPGEACEADFSLKSNDNKPLANHKFEYDVFVEGKNMGTLTGTTGADGKAVVKFSLPETLQANDGIVNVRVQYDGINESVIRAIPISLDFADLQFLPEGGNYIAGQPSNVFFIAKNEFGKPLDVSGHILDREGNRVAEFSSFYDGMGKFAFTPGKGQAYAAVITSPFEAKKTYALPAALSKGYSLVVEEQPEGFMLNILSPAQKLVTIALRNAGKVHESRDLEVKEGNNSFFLKRNTLPMGLYAISLAADNQVVAERLVFLNYNDGLAIELKTDKEQYLPREKVNVSVITKGKDGKPIASGVSVSVVDEKILSYIDDKQHNMLTWMFFGHELKENIHEPRFYFDEKEPPEKRIAALDLLINTHGWRRYAQDELNAFDGKQTAAMPEKSSDVEGFVLDRKNRPAALKVYLFSDTGKAYETYSNKEGYFKFTRTHFEREAWLVAESRSSHRYTIKNSVAHLAEVAGRKGSLKLSALESREIKPLDKPEGIAANMQQAAGALTMTSDSSALEEVVVEAYRSTSRKMSNAAVTTITSGTIEGRPNAAFLQTLQGQVPGLNITTGSGQPGANSTVVLRGYGSITGKVEPLFIIDGVPLNADAFRMLSPNDIESVSILKDAGSTAIYGCRGANGVIVVKTGKYSGGNGIMLAKTNHYTYSNIARNNAQKLSTPASFYMPVYATTETTQKTDFRNCIYWNATIQTDANGHAQFSYYNSDDTTTFSILAEGTSHKGDLGQAKLSYSVMEPLQSDLKLPLYISQEDVVKIPLWLKNNSNTPTMVEAVLESSPSFEASTAKLSISLAAGEARTAYFQVTAVKAGSALQVKVKISAGSYSAVIEKPVDIYGKGFPVSVAFSGTKSASGSFNVSKPMGNSIKSGLRFLVNPYNELSSGLESMLREPSGCFEQVSSSNYPNIMALQLLDARGGMDGGFRKKALDYLKNGYNKLKNYESKGGGFEWYGGNPGHEALTAYGLLQFHEMKEFIDIDASLVKRSVKWLTSRRDGRGGFKQHEGKYGFSSIKDVVNNAYIVYVLSETGEKGFDQEYQRALAEAIMSRDAYRSALMALAAYNRGDAASYKKLLGQIGTAAGGQDYGRVKVEQTVVYSYGTSQTVEWLSLYALAIMKEGKVTQELLNVLDHIQSCRNRGGFGSTQATALGLKAITAFSKIAQHVPGQPEVSASVNGSPLSTGFDESGNIAVNTTGAIVQGKNTFSVGIGNGRTVPYLFYVDYMRYVPDNSAQCQLQLKTSLSARKVKISGTVRINAEVTNTSVAVVNNPLVRIGIPGGMSPEPWQLRELVEKGVVDHYEIFGSELVLYFRQMGPEETRKITIDLKAQVPGRYQGIASSAYLYYNNEHKNWNDGLEVEITE
ncbi:TonB-dependent receptor plug domain-containing protein [uncultured Flavobacterium sp.]|uniref:TonB-dependent receptor plug domain-containing protein n=1 Tax=uncultured Flavobacterium sp. TaxID=165435 RepID=UPI0025E2D436|nr:TonB-dependent receptor plug domain-containing protein [uncultured Flavobacterium sp.]